MYFKKRCLQLLKTNPPVFHRAFLAASMVSIWMQIPLASSCRQCHLFYIDMSDLRLAICVQSPRRCLFFLPHIYRFAASRFRSVIPRLFSIFTPVFPDPNLDRQLTDPTSVTRTGCFLVCERTVFFERVDVLFFIFDGHFITSNSITHTNGLASHRLFSFAPLMLSQSITNLS